MVRVHGGFPKLLGQIAGQISAKNVVLCTNSVVDAFDLLRALDKRERMPERA